MCCVTLTERGNWIILDSSQTTEPIMTIQQAKASAFEFAQVMKMTKQQAISFTVAALNEKGFGLMESFVEVCGQEAWDMLSGHTPEEILEAVVLSY